LTAAVQCTALVLVAVTGTAVVLTREPLRQSIVLSFYGLLLGILFFLFQAPDVALSQITVGSVGVPLMLLLAIAKIKQRDEQRDERE
jgi:energy-converting hydrogenase B subunit D